KILFKDVGGIVEVKESLKEVVGFLKNPDYYQRLGARIPHGILLEGLPGTGKTMLAQAIANEAGVPFYYATGSEFHGMFVGLAASRVKKLFKTAKKQTSVIFIDEFESIGHKRMQGSSDAMREWNHTLTQLLSEMDGFKENDNVIVLAATNRADVLDPAVVRAGRFDRKINVPLPILKDRIEILKIHAVGKKFENMNLTSIAKQTVGFSGADLALLINEAAIVAGRERKEKISLEHINKALDKISVGEERRNLNLTKQEKRMIAYHEAGHALTAYLIPDADKVQRISILPHGQAGGFTRLADEKERITLSENKALATISVLLGGRIAEEMIGEITSGAQNDLQKCNELAREMVEHYGMGQQFNFRYVSQNSMGMKEASLENQKIIDEDINTILEQCHQKATELILNNREKLDKLTGKLLEVESLNAEELNQILE
ncbi:MAG: AAA family ATPase, partial [Lutibacter sp.]